MRKENLVPAKVSELTAPLTRARAAALRASRQVPPLKAPIQQNQKRTFRGNQKTPDLDENNNNAPNDACLQHKRRAVLKDVTNICCKSSYRNCFNATTIQTKNSKLTKKGQKKACKVAPSVVLEAPEFQAGLKTKILQERVRIEPKSEEVTSVILVERKAPLHLSSIREFAIDDHQLKWQSSGASSQTQSPPQEGGLSGDVISSNPDIVDIDGDYKEPQLCSVYAPDIYSNLRVAELDRRPYPNFMETIQRDITQSMRGILVDWLVEAAVSAAIGDDLEILNSGVGCGIEGFTGLPVSMSICVVTSRKPQPYATDILMAIWSVLPLASSDPNVSILFHVKTKLHNYLSLPLHHVSEDYKLVPDTLYLTVYLIDCFLTQNYTERQRLQLVGITCMLIASKYEEICSPRVEDFCFITDNAYTREEVLEMEIRILKYFGFQLFAPTAKTFLRRFLRAAQASFRTPSLEMEYLANYLAELTLIDYGFLNFLPSVIAASAVFLARWTLDQSNHPWNPTLEHYTCYKASRLKTTVVAIRDLQLNSHGCPLVSVRMKYGQQKFKSVAALASPKLLETLFWG